MSQEQEKKPGAEETKQYATAEAMLDLRNSAPSEELNIPWTGTIVVRGFMPADRAKWIDMSNAGDEFDAVTSQIVMVMLSCCDQAGARMFNKKDMGRLRELPCAVIEAICQVCRRLSGFDESTAEDILKNYGKALNDAS